ncbi:outer membrane beta-barrel protein [Flavobacterium sp. GA093]|uniref:Outer membrane beta-barrel protein n=1 Tax=Flavobacterium hydrocarbonoxydans TaxID=2683249 RepID=A0A6I4NTK4_9FLAO|nr:hypothetical protein [Flavobacterium hydrocarbonoxydans]MWB96392.1 outer membrane beta-barrel protein [Flavobacterium hydrocarbonoxydans]
MKKAIRLIVTVFMLSCTASYAQNNFRLNLYGAYTFEDNFDSYYDLGNYYQGQLQDGFQYGLGIELEVHPNSFVELSYLREDTHAPTQYYNGGAFNKYANFDVNMNYILLGGTRSFRSPDSDFEGFAGIMAGIGIIGIDGSTSNMSGTVTGNHSDSATKFAWGLKAGVTYWASKNVGIKFQGQMLSITQSVGGGVYFGTGGVSTGVSSYSSLYQFSLGGGLVFDLTN